MLVTFESSDVAGGSAPTVVAARGVLVLGTDETDAAVETRTGDRNAAGIGVTLLVTEDDAPRLAFAAAAGVVTLALVPPEDAAPVAGR